MKRRRALLASNPLRNSRSEADGNDAEAARIVDDKKSPLCGATEKPGILIVNRRKEIWDK